MSNQQHTNNLSKILRNLGIASGHSLEKQIAQFLMYCHHKRMLEVTIQLSLERKTAQKDYQKAQNVGKNIDFLKSRQQALLDPERIWLMAKSAYNQHLRDYAFLYLAFNLLEDSLRRKVDVHYSSKHKDSWFQDTSLYPINIIQKYNKNGELNKLCNLRNGHIFTERLSFGDIITFIYDSTAWNKHRTQELFTNHPSLDSGSQMLPNLSRCQVYEKLTILQWRRNGVYHHNLISKSYRPPSGAECSLNLPNYNDGTFTNTRKRIYEMFEYLGLRPIYVMQQIIGTAETISCLSNTLGT